MARICALALNHLIMFVAEKGVDENYKPIINGKIEEGGEKSEARPWNSEQGRKGPSSKEERIR